MADWSTADKALIEKVIKDSELQLSSMVRIATSADQRATALAGIFIAAATAISGGVSAVFFLIATIASTHYPPADC